MLKRWEKKLDIFGPIDQAPRCLETWLEEENRYLPEKQKQRAAALMARYFYHEEQVTDQLMLSFLRHYSGQQVLDMEDPTSVRMEIKTVLDQSNVQPPLSENKKRMITAFVVGSMMTAFSLGAWTVCHQQIDKDRQMELKALVHRIVELDQSITHSGVWAEVKAPLQIKSYQEMDWIDYYKTKKNLERKLHLLQEKAGVRI